MLTELGLENIAAYTHVLNELLLRRAEAGPFRISLPTPSQREGVGILAVE